ncbi:hypothetical protein [Streptomyces corynorhini]|nr:hypothetical protein [Streptomyces corynorhini]
MSEHCGVSYAQLSKAAGGERVPSWRVTEAYLVSLNDLRATGVAEDLDEWFDRWRKAGEREAGEREGGELTARRAAAALATPGRTNRPPGGTSRSPSFSWTPPPPTPESAAWRRS